MVDEQQAVGFIGLGVMGRPMAHNLLQAGFPLVVHSRSPGPVEELVSAGAVQAATPAEVAGRARVAITMLPDTPQVESVLFDSGGLAERTQAGSLVIDMSTIDPLATRRFAKRVSALGADYLDAPVSGGEQGAIQATLSIMIGGPEAAFERALPLLRAMGKTIVHVGESGAGQMAKACNQLVVASTIEAVAEALVFAEGAGVDATKVRAALLGGFASSRVLEVHGQRMLEGNFRPGFRSELHLKDARIVLSAARELGIGLPGFEVAADALAALVEAGQGALDHSALITRLGAGARDPGGTPG